MIMATSISSSSSSLSCAGSDSSASPMGSSNITEPLSQTKTRQSKKDPDNCEITTDSTDQQAASILRKETSKRGCKNSKKSLDSEEVGMTKPKRGGRKRKRIQEEVREEEADEERDLEMADSDADTMATEEEPATKKQRECDVTGEDIDTGDNGNGPLHQRRSQACTGCRSRKVKCDGGIPSCLSCRRSASTRGTDPASLVCVYPPPARPKRQVTVEWVPESAVDEEKGKAKSAEEREADKRRRKERIFELESRIHFLEQRLLSLHTTVPEGTSSSPSTHVPSTTSRAASTISQLPSNNSITSTPSPTGSVTNIPSSHSTRSNSGVTSLADGVSSMGMDFPAPPDFYSGFLNELYAQVPSSLLSTLAPADSQPGPSASSAFPPVEGSGMLIGGDRSLEQSWPQSSLNLSPQNLSGPTQSIPPFQSGVPQNSSTTSVSPPPTLSNDLFQLFTNTSTITWNNLLGLSGDNPHDLSPPAPGILPHPILPSHSDTSPTRTIIGPMSWGI